MPRARRPLRDRAERRAGSIRSSLRRNSCGRSSHMRTIRAMHLIALLAAALVNPTLVATVSRPKAPNAYTITLSGQDGTPVTSIPTGTYSIVVHDYSKIHNWALGSMTTNQRLYTGNVRTTGTKTFVVTLTPGKYAYACSAHPFAMNGTF